MKMLNLFFLALAVLIGLEAALFFFRATTVVFDFDGLLRIMWLMKVVTYAGVIVLCYYVFRVKRVLERHGFFNKTSIRHLQIIGLLAFLLTLTHAVANASMHTWKHYQKTLPWVEIRERFFLSFAEEVLDHSVVIYLLILSVFLLVSFSRKAIAVKIENETFV